MSYLTSENSKASGKPVFIYEFVQGENIWRFNSSPVQVIWNTYTWDASNIAHGEVNQSNEMAKDNLSLKFARTDAFARQFLGYAPDQITSIIIRRGHIDDGEFIVYWRGRVVGSKAAGNTIDIECESVFTSLRRPGLRARYQKTCRHALYQPGCNLLAADFTVNAQVTAISSNTVTVPVAAGLTAGSLIGGMLRFNTHYRLISNHVGSILTLSRPIEDLNTEFISGGSSPVDVQVYPGCDRTSGTCTTRFANWLNFGGFKWIPDKNPFGGSSIV